MVSLIKEELGPQWGIDVEPKDMPEVIAVDPCGTNVVEEWIVELEEFPCNACYVRKDLVEPRPSTDFSEVFSRPHEDFLLYEKGLGWVVGFYYEDGNSFHTYCHIDEEMVKIEPSHWLPLPKEPV